MRSSRSRGRKEIMALISIKEILNFNHDQLFSTGAMLSLKRIHVF